MFQNSFSEPPFKLANSVDPDQPVTLKLDDQDLHCYAVYVMLHAFVDVIATSSEAS